MKEKPSRFLATIYRIWMMRHVDVPEEVVRGLRKQMGKASKIKRKYVPVVAIVNSKSSRVSLVPAGGGRYRVQINTVQRKAARADVGDMVGVELRLDRESRQLPVPADLGAALEQRPRHRKAFAGLTVGQRWQFVKWFDSAKSPATRSKRLIRVLDVLLERALLSRRGKKSLR